tara:strand:+ start:580 stop:1284 length:705 start_codon:yes stop_codon:yes gene_type:complete
VGGFSSDSLKVLFFGRKNDSDSIKCLDHLRALGFLVEVIWSSSRLDKLPKSISTCEIDLIFCYRSYFILPKSILDLPKYYCINFHPGPPEHPGSGGINFALYDNEENFGTTVHLMEEKVDSGKILDVVYFPIDKRDHLESLLQKTHRTLFKVFKNFTSDLASEGIDFINYKVQEYHACQWSGKKRKVKEVDAMQYVSSLVDEEELNRRVRSFHCEKFPLKILLHGREFLLQSKK